MRLQRIKSLPLLRMFRARLHNSTRKFGIRDVMNEPWYNPGCMGGNHELSDEAIAKKEKEEEIVKLGDAMLKKIHEREYKEKEKREYRKLEARVMRNRRNRLKKKRRRHLSRWAQNKRRIKDLNQRN